MRNSHVQKAGIANKLMKLLGNILFALYMIIMIGLIFITAQSRFTGREPSLFNHRLYIVDSGSMSPTIIQDSMIIVKESEPQDIKEGDIITYYGSQNSGKVTHRVVEVQEQGKSFITKGDANQTNDPLPLDGERVIGKVIFAIPFVGMIFRFLSSIHGIISLAILGAFWIVGSKIFVSHRNQNKHSQQTMEINESH
ncbi:MAG: signal peptidase I [Caldicoprobacterales bacterium]|jgi:signal peptidase|nr:signal peptidase I [Clostridiales bacterium]